VIFDEHSVAEHFAMLYANAIQMSTY